MRYWLLAFTILASGCATLDSMQGLKSFQAVTGPVEVNYTGKETLSLWVGGQQVAVILPVGRGANWMDISRWEGSYQGAYLSVQCDKAHWRTGERQCLVQQVAQCSWDAVRNQCAYHTPKETIDTLTVGAPSTVFRRGKPSRLTGTIETDQVILSFDNKPTVKIPALAILEHDSSTRLYRGQFGEEKAEVYCKIHQTGYDNYQEPTFVCAAHKDVSGGSGRGFELAKIGEAVIPWSSEAYAALRRQADRFYAVNNWPRLNPNKPNEVPKPSAKKSDYAMLLEKEWAAWKN